MNESIVKKKLDELIGEVFPLLAQHREWDDLIKEDDSIDGSLNLLRLSVKYLKFDLEARERENTYLRTMLENAEGDFDEYA